MAEAPRLVGLMGAAQAGKDATAAALGRTLGYRRVAFADPLKYAALRSLEGLDALKAWQVQRRGWDWAKTETDWGRPFLQQFGVAIRDLDPDFWVRAGLAEADAANADGHPAVVTDVRFRNEAQAIREAGGLLVLVERPGVGPVNDHVSEHEWRGIVPDVTVSNVGTLDDLEAAATEAVLGYDPVPPWAHDSPPDWAGTLTCPGCLGPAMAGNCAAGRCA